MACDPDPSQEGPEHEFLTDTTVRIPRIVRGGFPGYLPGAGAFRDAAYALTMVPLILTMMRGLLLGERRP